jgi:hypothetical protein
LKDSDINNALQKAATVTKIDGIANEEAADAHSSSFPLAQPQQVRKWSEQEEDLCRRFAEHRLAAPQEDVVYLRIFEAASAMLRELGFERSAFACKATGPFCAVVTWIETKAPKNLLPTPTQPLIAS